GGWMFKLSGPRAEASELRSSTAQAGILAGQIPVLYADFFKGWTHANHAAELRYGLLTLCKETGKSFHYLAWLPAPLGLSWFRGLWKTQPGVLVLLVLMLFHIALILRVAVVAGYLSERHTLLIVLCGMPWAIAATLDLPRRLSIAQTYVGAAELSLVVLLIA